MTSGRSGRANCPRLISNSRAQTCAVSRARLQQLLASHLMGLALDRTVENGRKGPTLRQYGWRPVNGGLQSWTPYGGLLTIRSECKTVSSQSHAHNRESLACLRRCSYK